MLWTRVWCIKNYHYKEPSVKYHSVYFHPQREEGKHAINSPCHSKPSCTYLYSYSVVFHSCEWIVRRWAQPSEICFHGYEIFCHFEDTFSTRQFVIPVVPSLCACHSRYAVCGPHWINLLAALYLSAGPTPGNQGWLSFTVHPWSEMQCWESKAKCQRPFLIF